MSFRLAVGSGALVSLLLCGSSALGASLDVSPARIELVPGARSAELRLTNTGAEDLSVQVDAREWSQDPSGAEQLVATRALLAVPPLVTIPPGRRQIVRIGHLGEPGDSEQSFRVLVTELAPAADESRQAGLSVRLQLSIPVFVEPVGGPGAPRIVIDDVISTGAGTQVTLHNAGSAHARIEHIELRFADDWENAPARAVSRVRYVLPNASARLDIPPGSSRLTAIRIKSADGREWEHAVPAR